MCLTILDPVFVYIIHEGHAVGVWHSFVLLSVSTYIVLYSGKVHPAFITEAAVTSDK